MAHCEALIRERELSVSDRLQGRWFHDLPISGARCSRDATGDVCGVMLCWQHREKVTRWEAGVERLAPRADETFARWQVERRAEFVPQT